MEKAEQKLSVTDIAGPGLQPSQFLVSACNAQQQPLHLVPSPAYTLTGS